MVPEDFKQMSDGDLQMMIARTAYITANGSSGFVEASPKVRQMALDEIASRWIASLADDDEPRHDREEDA